MLDHFDVADLVKFAAIPNLRYNAIDVFLRKHGGKSIHIDDNIDQLRFENSVYVSGLKLALSVLEHFGMVILNLKITFHETPDRIDEVKKVLDYVNKYCNNLESMYLRTFAEDALESLKTPFPKLADLSLSGKLNKLSNNPLGFSDIFPNVKNIIIQWLDLTDGTNAFFPHLEYLYVQGIYGPNSEEAIKDLILENPRINSIFFESTKTSMIKFLADNRVNVEFLTIEELKSDYMYDIHFDSVKTLRIDRLSVGDLGVITCPQLKSFYCRLGQFPCVQFIANNNNTNLRRLSLNNIHTLSSDGLNMIMKNTPNLCQIDFSCGNEIDVDTLIQFMEESKYLRRLELYVDPFPQNKTNELKVRVENETMAQEWSVKHEFEFVIIERKKHKIRL